MKPHILKRLILAGILLGMRLMPLTTVQILWVNMVTSVTVSLALAFEPLDPDVMKQPPRRPGAPIINAYYLWRITFVLLLIGGGTLWVTTRMHHADMDEAAVRVARTVTMQCIVLAQWFHLFSSRSFRRSFFEVPFFSNPAVFVVSGALVLLQLGITYLPFMNRIFGTAPLSPRDWIPAVVLGLAVFLIVEAEKAAMRLFERFR